MNLNQPDNIGKILIAEDSEVNAKLATRMLTKLGYKTELARNGKEVIEKVSTESFALVLMDIQMQSSTVRKLRNGSLATKIHLELPP